MPAFGDGVNSGGGFGVYSRSNVNSANSKPAEESTRDVSNNNTTEQKLAGSLTTREA